MLILWTVFTLAFAQSPKWIALNLLEAEGGRAFVIAKDGHEYRLIEVDRDGTREPALREVDVNTRGLAFDLRLADRRQVIVPKADRPGHDRGRAYVVFPDRAPERLSPREITAADLVRLGLDDRVAVATAADPTPQPLKLPRDGIVLAIGPKQEVPALALSHGAVMLKGWSHLFLVVPPENLQRLLFVLGASGVTFQRLPEALTFPRAMSMDEALRTLEADDRDLIETVEALRALGRRPDEIRARLAAGEFRTLRAAHRGFVRFGELLADLRAALPRADRARALEASDAAFFGLPFTRRLGLRRDQKRVGELYQSTVDPLTELYVHVLKVFKGIDHPQARRLVLLGAAGAGARGLRLIDEPVQDEWLAWMSERVARLERVPALHFFEERRDLGWFVDLPNATLNELRTHVTLVDATEPTHDGRFANEFEALEALPLWRLGVRGDHEALRAALLNFIIAADHRLPPALRAIAENSAFDGWADLMRPSPEEANALRAYLTTRVAKPEALARFSPELLDGLVKAVRGESALDGSLVVHRVLKALRWPPRKFRQIPEFDAAVYAENAMDLLIDLLSVADQTLKTRGTYLSALEAALQLTRVAPGSSRAYERRIELAAVVNRRLLGHVARAARDCAGALAPGLDR